MDFMGRNVPTDLLLLSIIFGGLAVGLAVAILYYITLQRTLGLCRPRNRTMEPGMVWLNLIPCFSLYWVFRTVNALADSLKNEYQDRGMDDGSDYGRSLGIAMAVVQIFGSVIANLVPTDRLPMALVSFSISMSPLILLIAYWVRIAGYARRLRIDDARDDSDRRYDDDDDLPPRPRLDSPGSTDITKHGDDRIR